MKYLFLITGIIAGLCWPQAQVVVADLLDQYSLVERDAIKPPPEKNPVVSIATPSVLPDKIRSEEDSKQVIMYSTSWCGYCRKARQYFISNNISFVEYDIEKDERAGRLHGLLGGGGVPTILYGGKKMQGFSESVFNTFYP